MKGGGDSTDIPPDRVQKRDPFPRSFRGRRGPIPPFHSMGPTVCSLSLSSSSSSSCSPLLLPFALRLFQWQQTFCCKKRALGCAERRCRLFVFVCVCCVCFVLAFSNRALLWLLLFLQTVFSNFLNVLYVFVVELIIRAKVEGEDTEKLAMIFF